jgi:hypothetical protein
MRNRARGAALLVAAALALTGCSKAPEDTNPPDRNVKVTPVGGSADGLKQVALSALAVNRLGLRTKPITQGRLKLTDGSTVTAKSIPFAAVIYDPNGKSWTYTALADRTYVRSAIVISRIDGDNALLTAGPAAGTQVVTAGAPELLGAEYGVGEE